jgi:hypothetical protein
MVGVLLILFFPFGENGSFSGKLIDATGVPLSLYDVYIPGSPFFTVTDSSGAFVIDNIPEGNYMVYFQEVQMTLIRQGREK